MLRFSKVLGCLAGMTMFLSLPSFAQDLKGAIKLTESEQFEAAHKAFDALIAAQPLNGDNYYYYGECWLKQFFVDSMSVTLKDVTDPAIQSFTKGTVNDPTNPLNFVGLGRANILLKNFTVATDNFKKAKELMPLQGMNYKRSDIPVGKQALAYAKIAQAMLRSPDRKKEELLAIIENAIERDATVPEVYLIKGDIYLEYNDGSNAIIAYNKANDLDPQSCKAMVKIGQLWVRGKAYNDALAYYKDALKIDSTFAPAYRERAELYGLAGQWENGIKDYQKFLDLSGKNTYAKVRYASFLFMAKKYDEALQVIDEILAVDQSYAVLYRLAAYSYYETQKCTEGIKSIETLFKVSKNIIASDYAYYGKLLVKCGNDSLAIEKFQKSFEMDSTNYDILTDKAASENKIKDYNAAIKTYDIRINAGKGTTMDYYNQGKAYFNLKLWGKADTALKFALDKKPDFINALRYRAWANANMDTTSALGLAKPYYEALISIYLKTDSVKYVKDISEAYSYLMPYYFKQYNLNKKCEDAKNAILYCDKMLAIDAKNENALIIKKALAGKCPN
jgi:tetratricopeptide (TPR) repeat protein